MAQGCKAAQSVAAFLCGRRRCFISEGVDASERVAEGQTLYRTAQELGAELARLRGQAGGGDGSAPPAGGRSRPAALPGAGTASPRAAGDGSAPDFPAAGVPLSARMAKAQRPEPAYAERLARRAGGA